MPLGALEAEEAASAASSSSALDEDLSPTDCSEDSVEIRRRRSPGLVHSAVIRPSAKRMSAASGMPEEKRIRLMQQDAALLLPHPDASALAVQRSLMWAPFMHLGGWPAASDVSYYPPILPYHPFFHHPPPSMYLPFHPVPPPLLLDDKPSAPPPPPVIKQQRINTKKSTSKTDEVPPLPPVIAVKPAAALFSVETLLKESPAPEELHRPSPVYREEHKTSSSSRLVLLYN